MDDFYWMHKAIDLAKKGQGFTSPNPMVGAVIVKNDRIVGKGYHQVAGQAHAEVNAIADAGKNADGATLYVTLEPCNHTGKTPPCTQAILQSGICKVVVATSDPNPDVDGNGINYLENQGIEVVSGICEKEADKLNESFKKYITTKLPFVTIKCAATLDGQIATKTKDSKWITGDKSRQYVHEIRHAVDAILVGVGTVESDDPSLTTRLASGKGVDPLRLILDTRLSIPATARLLHQASDAPTYIVTGSGIDEGKKETILSTGAHIIEAPIKKNRVDLNWLMSKLGEMNLTSLLIEGGSRVFANAFSCGIVDKALFFYAPKVLGGNDGIPVCSGAGAERMENSIQLKAISSHRFDNDILIEGYVA